MPAKVTIGWSFPKLLEAVKAAEDEINLLVAATLQTNRGMMFNDSNAGRLTPWAKPLLRDGQPLSQKGALRQSFAPQNDGKTPGKHKDGIVRMGSGTVTIGTTLAYAPILNDGGVIRPRRGKWLWIPLPDGKARSSNAPSKVTKELKKQHGKKAVFDGDEYVLKTQKKSKSGWIWSKTEGGALVVKAPSGKYFLLARKATIPARPMTEWTVEDQQELEETLRNKLAEILNRAT